MIRDESRGAGGGKAAPVSVEVETAGGLGALLVVAFFCAGCWLAVGLLVIATLLLDAGWIVPMLVALALVTGTAVGLFPTFIYRGKARASEAALRALAVEVMAETLIEIEQDPSLQAQVVRPSGPDQPDGRNGS